MFDKNQLYTRRQIHDILGEGGLDDYLPHKNKEIVCGCFREDTNPEAPDIILVGNGRDIYRYACIFCKQKHFVPVFIKKAVNEWRYVGDYRVERWSESASDISKQKRLSGRTEIRRVLFLEQEQNA